MLNFQSIFHCTFRPLFHHRSFATSVKLLKDKSRHFPITKDESILDDVHLDPQKHEALLNEPNPAPDSSKKLLKVCVLGIPNAGKSTLINQLVGGKSCPYSRKAHTTRFSSQSILTEGDTQIIFTDTPGVTKPKDFEKFKLASSFIKHPIESAKKADLILVLQDISNRYTRENLDKSIQRLLCFHALEIPSVLVLNKLDLIKDPRDVFRLVNKLTCGYLQGNQKLQSKTIGEDQSPICVDRYLKRKKQESEKQEEPEVSTYDDFLKVLTSGSGDEVDENTVIRLTNGLVGWPGFHEVFSISAGLGKGTEDLKNYLLSQAKENSSWLFHPDLKTDLNPAHLVQDTVKSKCLEVLDGHVAYKLVPRIADWKVENGVLRLNVQIVTSHKNERIILRDKGNDLRLVAKLSESDLQDFFGKPVFIYISVHTEGESLRKTKLPFSIKKTVENRTHPVFV